MKMTAGRIEKQRAFRAILWGGLAAGILDLTAAIAIYGTRGVRPIRVLQSIASGLLGADAFKGGVRTAVLGVALHFVIAFVAAAVYYFASRPLRFLVRRAVLWGLLYGVGIYVFMNYLVVPLSAVAKRPFQLQIAVIILIVHMLFVGLPIALAVRRVLST